MKKKQVFLFLGLCTAGLATGHAVKRFTATPSAAVSAANSSAGSQSAAGTATADESAAATKARTAAVRSTLKSKDTLDSIKTAEGADLYSRVALWMVDASEEDIASYWQHYRQQKNRANDINDLIFINWTRINPQGATAAAKGTPDEHYAWWAWACHDPATALSTALSTNPDRVNNVTWGIGEFHPNWLLEHFDELPKDSQGNAISGMAKWDDGGDPLEKLEFLKSHGHGFHPGIFKVLAMRDPWAAYDYLQQNGTTQGYYYYGQGDTMSTFIDIVSDQSPDVLKRIIEQAPSGEVKRKMESALFTKLLESDPEAAVKQAEDTKAPVIAAQRYSAAAMHYLATDPDKAFELAKAMFTACPSAMALYTTVEVENSSSSWGGNSDGEMQQVMAALMAKDPVRTMEMSLPSPGNAPHGLNTFNTLANQWAEQNLAGLAEWTKQQTDPSVRDSATSVIIGKCQNEQDYASAIEWSLTLSNPDPYLNNLVSNWGSNDPDGAREWLESADLPAEKIEKLMQKLPQQP